MKTLNFVQVPSDHSEDVNQGKTFWKGSICTGIDAGKYRILYIGHHYYVSTDEEGNKVTTNLAFPIKVEKPVTRDKAINQAEMEAYNLISPMDVASFGSSLSRKFRDNHLDSEVKEHDEFIKWVKEELTKIGF